MMTKRKILQALAPIVLLLTSASPAAAQDAASELRLAGRLVVDTVDSHALKSNILGDPARQQVVVYLPPGYDRASTRRYPSVYLLPPFDGSPSTWTRAWPGLFGQRPGVAFIDSVMAAGEVPPMIVVMPNGRNRYHGSFFFNSPISGNWEDFLTIEIVRHVDQTYRTLPTVESRGVAGHSMGGNAAVHLGMRHPEIFGAVYALSACCLGGYDLFGMAAWERVLDYSSFDVLQRAYQQGDFPAMVLVAAGVTITPNRERSPFFFDLPYEKGKNGLQPVEPAFSMWRQAGAREQIETYADNLRKLRGLRLDHGNRELDALMSGVRRFSQALAERGIPHAYEVYDGNHHDRIMERLATRVLPFFAQMLRRSDSTGR
jgi:S-formylglutathione hydrolase